MPRYKLPDYIVEPKIINFFNTISLQFRVRDEKEWSAIYGFNGYRQNDDAILPLTSPYLIGHHIQVPVEDLHVSSINLLKREIIMTSKRKHCENMDFPKGTWAVIIDTDLPVTDHFADNLCSYCTGLLGKKSFDIWVNQFYQEMAIEGPGIVPNEGYRSPYRWLNPYTKHAQVVWVDNTYLTPCSPWPTADWASNGLYEFVNLATLETVNGRLLHGLEVYQQFQWPARMSAAIFFTKELHVLQFDIIEARCKKFCKKYPNATYGQYHNVMGVRQIKLSEAGYEVAAHVDYTPQPKGRRRVKVEIEEIGRTL